MWAQIPHSEYVFEHWAKGQSGATFAWGFEAAVLMFVVRGMHVASWIFAGLSALINVGYYGLQDVEMWTWPNKGNWVNWLLSVVLPFAIAMYSHVLAHVQDEEAEALHFPTWAHLWRMKLASKVAEWRQGKADASQVASPMQEEEPLSPTPQEDASEDAIDPKTKARQLASEGFTNAQIASMIGKSESTVSRYLNGVNKLAEK
jgi:hypothetical protein